MLIKRQWDIKYIEKQDSGRVESSNKLFGPDYFDFTAKGKVVYKFQDQNYTFNFQLRSDSLLLIDSSDTLFFIVKKLSREQLIISTVEDSVELTYHCSNEVNRYPYLKRIKNFLFENEE